MTNYTYGDGAPRGSAGASVRWNAIALVGRQGVILVVSVILAGVLGPTAYGIVAQANVFMTLATLLLDQGLTASLVSQRSISARLAGAASSLNILLSGVLFLLIVLFARPISDFLTTPELVQILPVLGAGLIFKAVAIVPRMLLTRQLFFSPIAAAEVYSALVGGVAGLVAAWQGAGYWSIVIQLIVTDFVAAIIFIWSAKPPWPNLAFRALRDSLGFGVRVFFGNLVAFGSRNVDNLLIGKFAGSTQLGFYSLAYRVLLTPIQMIGQTVTRVLFPAIAAAQGDRAAISGLLIKSTRSIALASFPLMAFVAISAPDTIQIFLGSAWLPAVPVLMILGITGARQAVTSTNAPLLLGSGRADLHLRFNLVAAAVQIAGIVAGLPWGIVGVAWGYTIAGFVLTPVIGYLQKLLAGTTYRKQLGALFAPLVCSILAASAYYALVFVEIGEVVRLCIGLSAFVVIYAVALRLLFPRVWKAAIIDVTTLLPNRPGRNRPRDH